MASLARKLALALLLAVTPVLAHAAELTVSAAASLTNAFRELGPAFEAANPGTQVLRNFASNSLVVIVPAGNANVPKSVNDLALPAYARVAIGLPASVPVGRYTKGVLEAAKLWGAI